MRLGIMHMPERARRIEVFTGAGRRRTWPADEKAAIVAESDAQLFTWRRLSRRARLPVKEPPVRFAGTVIVPRLAPSAVRATAAWACLCVSTPMITSAGLASDMSGLSRE